MLKLIYLESGIYVEWLDTTVEEFLATRKLLAATISADIYVEIGYASMLIAADPAHLAILQLAIASINSAKSKNVSLASADRDYLEVSFPGIWISSNLESEIVEGIFVADLGNLESDLYKIWLAQPQLTSLV